MVENRGKVLGRENERRLLVPKMGFAFSVASGKFDASKVYILRYEAEMLMATVYEFKFMPISLSSRRDAMQFTVATGLIPLNSTKTFCASQTV